MSTEVGCYVLHISCVNGRLHRHPENALCHDERHPWGPRALESQREFTGANLREARREARSAGWRRRDSEWVCPTCYRTPEASE